MNELQQYLPLYLGQKVQTFSLGDKESFGVLTGIELDARPDQSFVTIMFQDNTQRLFRAFEVKLILRPLSSMTEEEIKEMEATQETVKLEGYPEITLKADSGETFLYMLSKGFDLFNLKERGLAIYPEEL